jgi:hypothetical protein
MVYTLLVSKATVFMARKGKDSGLDVATGSCLFAVHEDAVRTVQDSPANQRLFTVEDGCSPKSVAGTGARAGPHKNILILCPSR